jgi:hypothetical protein
MQGRLDNAKITGCSSRVFVRDERDQTWHTVGEFQEQLDDVIHSTHERLFKLNQSENFQEHYQVTQGDRSKKYSNHMEI